MKILEKSKNIKSLKADFLLLDIRILCRSSMIENSLRDVLNYNGCWWTKESNRRKAEAKKPIKLCCKLQLVQ